MCWKVKVAALREKKLKTMLEKVKPGSMYTVQARRQTLESEGDKKIFLRMSGGDASPAVPPVATPLTLSTYSHNLFTTQIKYKCNFHLVHDPLSMINKKVYMILVQVILVKVVAYSVYHTKNNLLHVPSYRIL